MPNVIPLAHLAGRLMAEYGQSPSYIALYRAVVSSRIPAHQVGKYWYVLADDLPAIAVALKVARLPYVKLAA